MNVWLATDIEMFKFPDITPLDFCLWGWMKNEVYKRKVDTRDKLIACILGAVASNSDGQHVIFAHDLQS